MVIRVFMVFMRRRSGITSTGAAFLIPTVYCRVVCLWTCCMIRSTALGDISRIKKIISFSFLVKSLKVVGLSSIDCSLRPARRARNCLNKLARPALRWLLYWHQRNQRYNKDNKTEYSQYGACRSTGELGSIGENPAQQPLLWLTKKRTYAIGANALRRCSFSGQTGKS